MNHMKISTILFWMILVSFFYFLPIRSTAQNSDQEWFTFLQQKYFENEHGRYNDFLIQELNRYLDTISAPGQQDHVLYMLSNVYLSKGDTLACLYTEIKLLSLYPSSPLNKQMQNNIRSLLKQAGNIELSQVQPQVFQGIQSIVPSSETEEGWFSFLSFIHRLSLKSFRPFFKSDLNRYFTRYGTNGEYTDIMWYWLSEIYRQQKKCGSAKAYLQEILKFFPQTRLQAEVYYTLGTINYHCLSLFPEAQNDFLQVIDNFPRSGYAARSQFYLAEMLADSMHNEQEAIANYQLFIDAFGRDSLVTEAALRLARLLEKKKKYTEALTAYMKIVEKNQQPEAVHQAFLSIAELYKTALHQRERHAATLLMMVNRFPEDSLAAHYLLEAGLEYKKLHNIKKARQIFGLLVARYPMTSEEAKAKEELNVIH